LIERGIAAARLRIRSGLLQNNCLARDQWRSEQQDNE
jgi:hypothetical protein